MADVLVEVWSDVVCPWCYIGKRRLEAAIAEFEHGDHVEVVWRSFELNPRAPRVAEGDLLARVARKYGVDRDQALAMYERINRVAEEAGLHYRFDIARPGNTFDAHRLIHLAHDHGLQGEVKERFLAAYQVEGEAIGDAAVLRRLAIGCGLPDAEVDDVLGSDRYAEAVRADEHAAADLSVTGVPFFLVQGGAAVPGAQDVDTMVHFLRRAWERSGAAAALAADPEATCGPGACELY